MENQNKEGNDTIDYLFVGFMFVGIAVGMLFNSPGVGAMGGMGLGFIASAIYSSKINK